MAVGKEIRNQISSITSTRKITGAMEMVAASKMRQAQENMSRGKPYARYIRAVVAHLAGGHLEYKHHYLEERPLRRCGYIVIASDRGLCGGLNINLFKAVLRDMRAHADNGVEIDLCTVGNKADTFFRGVGGNIVASAHNPGEKARVADLIGIVGAMLERYHDGALDRLFLASNEFINTMTQQPTVEQVLPLVADPHESIRRQHWDYIYEPDDARELLNGLLKRYIESQVYQAVVENGACEQAARMVAMKSATENAGNLIDELQLQYNKARQAAITQELAEIVSGAAAV